MHNNIDQIKIDIDGASYILRRKLFTDFDLEQIIFFRIKVYFPMLDPDLRDLDECPSIILLRTFNTINFSPFSFSLTLE